MCSPLAHYVAQPAGSPFCAAGQPAENLCFSFGNTALQPARPGGLPFSVIRFFNVMAKITKCLKYGNFHIHRCLKFFGGSIFFAKINMDLPKNHVFTLKE